MLKGWVHQGESTVSDFLVNLLFRGEECEVEFVFTILRSASSVLSNMLSNQIGLYETLFDATHRP
jgi:hypothetical protein